MKNEKKYDDDDYLTGEQREIRQSPQINPMPQVDRFAQNN